MVNYPLSKKEDSEIAYTIPDLPFGISLNIKKSANAWWMEQYKVQKLFAAFSITATIPEACSYAGITIKQYKYFVELYPEVTEIRKGLKLGPGMKAKMTIMRAIDNGDMKVAMWYLEKRCPDEFGTPAQRDRARKKEEVERIQIETEENNLCIKRAMNAFNEEMRKCLTEKSE